MALTILQKVLGVIQDGKTVPLHCCTFASLNSGVCAVDCQHQGIFWRRDFILTVCICSHKIGGYFMLTDYVLRLVPVQTGA